MTKYKSAVSILYIILLRLFFPGGVLLFGETPAEAMSLALANSRALASVRSEISAARYEKTSTTRSFLPTVSTGSSYQYNSAEAEISLPAPINSSVSLVQPHTVDLNAGVQWVVFTGFAREANLRIREIALNLKKNKLQSVERQTALETLILYRQVQNAALQLTTLESGRDRIALQVKQLEDRVEQGMASHSDLLTLKLSLLEYDEQINRGKADLEKAKEGLKEKTGREIQVVEPTEALQDTIIPAIIPDKLPEIMTYGLQGNLSDARARLQRSPLYPQLAVNSAVHYGIPGADPVANDWMLYTTAGISLNWSTDWGAAQAEALAEEFQKESLYEARAEAVSQKILRYKQDESDLKAMIENLEVLRQSSRLSKEKADITENQYQQGMATVNDFSDAALAQTQADLRYKAQLLLILLKRNQLEAQSGVSIEEWSVSQ